MKPRISKHSGFTLMEILVVVLVIGIIISIAVLRVSGGADRQAEVEAKRFVALLNFVRDESIFSGKMYGISIDEATRAYTFYVEDEGWKPVTGDKELKTRTIPEPLTITIKNKDPNKQSKKQRVASSAEQPKPEPGREMIIVRPVGDISPFDIVVASDDVYIEIGLDDDNEPIYVKKDPDAV